MSDSRQRKMLKILLIKVSGYESLSILSRMMREKQASTVTTLCCVSENFARDKNPTNYNKAGTESPSARQTDHLLSLIDINKTWENVAWMMVIKNTQNTNHYLISVRA